MSDEGRTHRERPKLDYFKLHNTGRDSSEEEFDNSDSEFRSNVNTSLLNNTVLAINTPSKSNTPVVSPCSVNTITETASIVITQDSDKTRSRSSINSNFEPNMADPNNEGSNPESSLQDEITAVELEERIAQAENERAELERKAVLLTKQLEIETKERQIIYMKNQIEKLVEARNEATQNPMVFNPGALGDDNGKSTRNLTKRERRKGQIVKRRRIKETRRRKSEKS